MIRTHIFLPEPLLNALKVLAEKQDVSVAALIRRAIEDYLKRQK